MTFQTVGLYAESAKHVGEYLCFHFSDDRFTGIQSLLGIQPIPPFPEALQWVSDREQMLSKEQVYWDSIAQPHPYCRFELIEHSWGERSIAYETTSGTIVIRSSSNRGSKRQPLAIVMLPLKRKLGNHHRLLSLCQYLSTEDTDRYENIHLLPAAEQSIARAARAIVYDAILVPLGFEGQSIALQQNRSRHQSTPRSDVQTL